MSVNTHDWIFSVVVEGLKIVDTLNGDTHYLLLDNVMFSSEDDDVFVVTNMANGNIMKMRRSECTTPPTGSDMESFLDSMVALASA